MVIKGTFASSAALVDAALVEWAEKTVMSIPALRNMRLTHLLSVSLEMALCGFVVVMKRRDTS